jgi:hypothetical protein
VEEIARIVAQIRARWPSTRIILRADSGFARDALMTWCEANGVDFIFGPARNLRLSRAIGSELVEARAESETIGGPARRFKELIWSTRKSWSRQRRVIAKAEWTRGDANPRFIVTSLTTADGDGRRLYEEVYCARGEMENRIKECQMDLFADRTSTGTMKANQLRLWFASMAYAREPTPHGLAGDRSGRCQLRQHSPQAVQDWRARHHQRAPHQIRDRARLSLQSRDRALPPLPPTPAEQRPLRRHRHGGSRNASARPPSPACRALAIPRLASGEHSGQPVSSNRDNIRQTASRCLIRTLQNDGVRYPGYSRGNPPRSQSP